MATPNWKNGASWEAIPAAALASSYRGTMHVAYPQATEFDGNGIPCGAVGRPKIVIEAPLMTETGFAFWRGKFSTAADTYVAISIESWSPRSGTTTKWAGKLCRPTFASVGVGAATTSTMYRDVRIEIVNCEATT